jgi:tetratricopeptide (TPR) repeat protein
LTQVSPRNPFTRQLCTTLLTIGLALTAIAQNPTPDNFEALLKQGFALHQQARFAEAIPVLQQAHRLRPADYFANLLLGIDMLRTGDPEASIPKLQLAARVRPKEPIPEEYLGEAEAHLGNYERAGLAYQAAVERSHGSEDALEAWAGFALERFRDIGAGLRSSDAGIAVAHQLQKAAVRPGTACEGSIPALERQLGQKASVAPRTRASIAGKLSICYALAAGKAADKLQTSTEDPAAIDRLRGDVLLRLKGDAAGASREYQNAIAVRPGDPGLLERLAEAQLTSGDMEAARASAKAALQLNPHEREALRSLVTIAMTERDYDQALTLLRQLAEEAPGDLNVQVDLGRALVQTNKAAEALQHLEPALKAGYPDEKGALHALEARALRQVGRKDEAEKASAEARRRSDAFQARSKEGGREKPNEH